MISKKRLKKGFKIASVGLVIVLMLIFINDLYTRYTTRSQHFNKLAKVPVNKVGMVLGTSKYVIGGYKNTYYQNRIKAALKLYKADKIRYILISGDNSEINYNEPQSMKNDLIKLGVSPEHIYLDFAGFRTFDSIIRGKKVFGLDSLTIISQQFHNVRALHIANANGMHAVAYNAEMSPDTYSKMKMYLREVLARVKMRFDLLFNTQPHFLGKKEQIP